MRFKCEKHGELEPHERVIWNKGYKEGPWCVYCVSEMMDKVCGKLIKIGEKNEPR